MQGSLDNFGGKTSAFDILFVGATWSYDDRAVDTGKLCKSTFYDGRDVVIDLIFFPVEAFGLLHDVEIGSDDGMLIASHKIYI